MTTTEVTPAPTQRRRLRPLTEYWDFRTATWRTAPAVPVQRTGS